MSIGQREGTIEFIMKRSVSIALLFAAFALCVPAQEPTDCPIQITRWRINVAHLQRTFGGLSKEPTVLTATIQNNSTGRVNKVEFQFDVIDAMRRTTKERLFITIDDPGLGDRSIAPGKSREWRTELGDTRFPEGCDSYGTVFGDTKCLGNLKINVIHFKDGTTWERKGWRDEPNPNNK